MPLYYNLADVCISIASQDSNPVSVLEAMACGTPLVVSDETGTEWVTPGENGYAISPDAPGELAGALLELLQSSDQRDKFRRSGLARVRHDGDEQAWMDRLGKLYHGLLA